MQVPSVTAVETIEGHHGLGIGFVPASAAAFETLGGGFALSLGWAAADLPVATAELRIANHLPPLSHITQESVGSVSLATPQRGAPGHELVPGRLTASRALCTFSRKW